MNTGVLIQNWIIDFHKPSGYPIGLRLKIYEDNQATIKRVLADIITPESRPIDSLITALHGSHLRNKFEMADTISNTQSADLKSKTHGKKRFLNLIDCAIGTRFYPPPGSLHYQLIRLVQLHGPTHINCEQNKKSDIKIH